MKVALIGNQNSGKTTLFNYLTGMNAKIGNWPGVTIDKKVGFLKGTKHEIIDLPGIYSLSPYSIEEEISRKYLFEEKPDAVVNIIDATNIERSLYLTMQLLELDVRVIVALNMVDILNKKGMKINEKKLEEILGARVLKISALKETGIEELIKELEHPKNLKSSKIEVFDERLENAITEIGMELNDSISNKRFVSVKLLEEDLRFEDLNSKTIKEIVERKKNKYEVELEEEIATQRYRKIEEIEKETVSKVKVKESISDKLDKILLNKWIAFPLFVLIMFLVYYLSVGVVGMYTVDWTGEKVELLGSLINDFLTNIKTTEMLISLIVNGIIAGVGAVLGFVPQLIILFLLISLLETTGYMSRIALLLDKLFRKIGLSGKSLIPFIVGSGCSVPGIMGSRIIENEDERKMTAILTPFVPCSAKLPIIALFSGYFFGDNAGFVAASLYFFAIIVIIMSALVMKKFVYKNVASTYISELPDYKMPSAKYVLKDVSDKIWSFIKRAGSVIMICSIVIWFLTSFSFTLEYGVDVEKSMLASIGKCISWIFYPMLGTNNWGSAVSAIQGLVAKEQVISSMAIINGLSEDVIDGSMIFNEEGIFGFYSMASSYAFMVFNLFSAPCFGAIGALKRELGSFKRMLKAISFQTLVAYILAILVYQVGIRMEKGIISLADVIITLLILFVIMIIILKNTKNKNECASCPYCLSCDKKIK